MRSICLVLLAIAASGCGTLLSRYENDPYFMEPAITRIYSGTRLDFYGLGAQNVAFFALLDLPLSLVADTLLLPVTLYEEFYEGELQQAAADGDVETIIAMLDKGKAINGTDAYGHTALMSAAWAGHLKVVQLLISRGAAVNAQTNGWTPLVYASMKGHPGIVRALLQYGADVNAKTAYRGTALTIAAGRGYSEIVHVLLEKGAEVDARGGFEWTPLISAASQGHTEIMEVLLKKGAEVNAKDNSGGTALLYASCNGQKEAVQLLLDKGADVRIKRDLIPKSRTHLALGCAAVNGHAAIAELLRKAGAEE